MVVMMGLRWYSLVASFVRSEIIYRYEGFLMLNQQKGAKGGAHWFDLGFIYQGPKISDANSGKQLTQIRITEFLYVFLRSYGTAAVLRW